MRIPFPFIAYTHDDLCRKIRDYIQSFGKGCRIIRRAEFLEEIRYKQLHKRMSEVAFGGRGNVKFSRVLRARTIEHPLIQNPGYATEFVCL